MDEHITHIEFGRRGEKAVCSRNWQLLNPYLGLLPFGNVKSAAVWTPAISSHQKFNWCCVYATGWEFSRKLINIALDFGKSYFTSFSIRVYILCKFIKWTSESRMPVVIEYFLLEHSLICIIMDTNASLTANKWLEYQHISNLQAKAKANIYSKKKEINVIGDQLRRQKAKIRSMNLPNARYFHAEQMHASHDKCEQHKTMLKKLMRRWKKEQKWKITAR